MIDVSTTTCRKHFFNVPNHITPTHILPYHVYHVPWGKPNLPDVAVPVANVAMGDTVRGTFPPGKIFILWEALGMGLKLKLPSHTADWSLFLETEHLQMPFGLTSTPPCRLTACVCVWMSHCTQQ